MNENNNHNQINNKAEVSLRDIKSHVLQQIHDGNINMKPKFHHIIKIVSLVVVAFVTLLISSFLVSFIIFSIVESGKLFLLGFGGRGFLMFFVLFPWPLLVIEIAFIILLEWLIKKFKFGYRSSLLTLVLVVLCISIVISIVINITSIHNTLLREAENQNLPVVGGFYRGLHRPRGAEIFRGVVSQVSSSSFDLIENGDSDNIPDEMYRVILPPVMNPEDILNIGDNVFVAGQQLPDQLIHAYGIQVLLSPNVD